MIRAAVPDIAIMSDSERQNLETEMVLSLCIFDGSDPIRSAGALARYNNRYNKIIGARLGGRLVGLVGIHQADDQIEKMHLSVVKEMQCKGIGKRLINHLRSMHHMMVLVAETDKDAVGFYRKCGFECESIGEKYPGTERFQCKSGVNNKIEPGQKGI